MPNTQLRLIKKKGGRTRRRGGQWANDNSQRHGFYADISEQMLHQGSKVARALRQARLDLVSALGGDLTPQEKILLERVLAKTLKCWLAESAMMSGEQPDEGYYLALSNSLRL